MSDYSVNYSINVDITQATKAIEQFKSFTSELNAASKQYQGVAREVNKLSTALSKIKPIKISANTQEVSSQLNRINTLINGLSKQKTVKIKVGLDGWNNLGNRLRSIRNTYNTINNKAISPKVDNRSINSAYRALDRLSNKLAEIKKNSKINITANVTENTKQATAATVNRTRRRVNGLYPSTYQVMGPSYVGSGTNIAGEMVKGFGAAYGLSTLMSGITDVIRESAEYNNLTQTTKNILATHDTGANFDGRFEQMNRIMRQVGVETRYSAPEVAEAGKFLAMAGLNVEQIKNSIRPISDIALIGDTELGETADVMTNIMTAYEIPSEKMNRAADILAMTFTATNTTLMDLAESFKYAGTVAHQSGLDFEQASAAFGILGDAGIQGSHAGTTLRMMLLNMLNPTFRGKKAWETLGISTKDANGDLRDFVELMTELNEKQKSMGKGEFQTLINQMFRVTAAPGALALIQNADKLRKVTGLNEDSYGLASDLADEKKNTILGRWYEMTSTFTETGMRQFEKLQGPIIDVLNRLIVLFNSDDFAEGFHSALKTVIDLVNSLIDVFKTFLSIWNSIPSGVKEAIVWFTKLQIYVEVLFGSLKMFRGIVVGIKGIFMGAWLSNAMASVVNIAKTLKNIYIYTTLAASHGRFGKSLALFEGLRMGLGFGTSGVGGAARGAAAGAATRVGAAAGGRAASILAGAATGGTSTFGLVSGLAMSTPWTAALVAALAGIGFIGYKIYETSKITEEATRVNEQFAESFRTMGTDTMELSSRRDVILGNMRIFTNELTTHNEKVQQSIDLWKRWHSAVDIPNSEESKGAFAETQRGQDLKLAAERADKWFRDPTENPYIDMAKKMGATVKDNRLTLKSGVNFGLNLKGAESDNAIAQITFARYARDPENKDYVALQNYLYDNLFAAKIDSVEEAKKVWWSASNRYYPSKDGINHALDYVSPGEAASISEDEMKKSMTYVYEYRDFVKPLFDVASDYISILEDFDAGKPIDPMRIQRVAQVMFGDLFDPQNGLFGSESWITKLRERIANPPDNMTSNQVVDEVNEVFQSIVEVCNSMGKYGKIFSGYLNELPWLQGLGSNIGLPLGPGKNGNNKVLDKSGQFVGGGIPVGKFGEKKVFNGKQYTYTSFGGWVDKDGNQLELKDLNAAASPASALNDMLKGNADKGSTGHANGGGGYDESVYKNHYTKNEAAPKQLIVRIENLMRIDRQEIDMTDGRQVAAVNSIKQQLASALLDVVQDFNANVI